MAKTNTCDICLKSGNDEEKEFILNYRDKRAYCEKCYPSLPVFDRFLNAILRIWISRSIFFFLHNLLEKTVNATNPRMTDSEIDRIYCYTEQTHVKRKKYLHQKLLLMFRRISPITT